jgi:hypothetical protein
MKEYDIVSYGPSEKELKRIIQKIFSPPELSLLAVVLTGYIMGLWKQKKADGVPDQVISSASALLAKVMAGCDAPTLKVTREIMESMGVKVDFRHFNFKDLPNQDVLN